MTENRITELVKELGVMNDEPTTDELIEWITSFDKIPFGEATKDNKYLIIGERLEQLQREIESLTEINKVQEDLCVERLNVMNDLTAKNEQLKKENKEIMASRTRWVKRCGLKLNNSNKLTATNKQLQKEKEAFNEDYKRVRKKYLDSKAKLNRVRNIALALKDNVFADMQPNNVCICITLIKDLIALAELKESEKND